MQLVIGKGTFYREAICFLVNHGQLPMQRYAKNLQNPN